ncbi:acetyl-CoA carboxylase biotin carboxyl carrier protein [Haloimpatiens lingqiaonensis]|uniref:acetyl-CoA carboxylase biotin carboxyl carrier protein n=1 Tax=Haloimpatiens lingqiaonensis TaxID=1380675 RepID=UPI0010FCF8D7|nr:acetyl-CoA carboxylase biotin carboxyl carrier protein [Haloimpatiens lingqiaonensis]
MNYKEICDLINTVSESKLTSFEIEIDGVHLKMGKEEKILIEDNSSKRVSEDILSKGKEENYCKKEVALEKEIQIETEAGSKGEALSIQDDKDIEIIKSPIVGTFYAAPAPDKDNFVSIGSVVNKGTTLCIIEAMKLMNDIESEFHGEIVDILVKNEDMVEYGQPLFKIRIK